MDEEVKKIMAEQFAKLPAELQAVLRSPKLGHDIKAIGQKQRLHLDQLDILENEVVYLLMGFTEPEEFVPEIEKSLHINKIQAQQVAEAVESQIIEPLRTAMRDAATAEPVEAPAPTPVPATAPAPKADMHPADVMLSQKTVTAAPPPTTPTSTPPSTPPATPPPVPPAPLDRSVATGEAKPYTVDPYREPIN